MKPVYLWALQHRRLARVLIFLLVTGAICLPFCLLALLLDLTLTWNLALFALLGLLWAWLLPNFCFQQLTKRPLELLHHTCDPYPYLELTQELMNLKLPHDLHQLVTIDYCAMLQETGRAAEAYNLLSALNMDVDMGVLPVYKTVYYNNLRSLCLQLGDTMQADLWYGKMMQLYQSMPANKAKTMLTPSVISTTAEHHLRRGEYQQTIAALNSVQMPHLALAVNSALLDAKAQLAMGRYDIAANRLNYVIANGNRLGAVAEARALLPQCTAPAPKAE